MPFNFDEAAVPDTISVNLEDHEKKQLEDVLSITGGFPDALASVRKDKVPKIPKADLIGIRKNLRAMGKGAFENIVNKLKE